MEIAVTAFLFAERNVKINHESESREKSRKIQVNSQY